MYEHKERFRTPPGHRFADRELLNIARLGLSRIYTGRDSEVSDDMRECARQCLSRLEGRTSLDNPGTGKLAGLLAEVLSAQDTARSQVPDRSLGDFPLLRELSSLRELADAVREYLGFTKQGA